MYLVGVAREDAEAYLRAMMAPLSAVRRGDPRSVQPGGGCERVRDARPAARAARRGDPGLLPGELEAKGSRFGC